MFLGKSHNQTILEFLRGDYISATADSFLIDRQARELSRHALKFYREFLRTFIEYWGRDDTLWKRRQNADGFLSDAQ